jgi:hypothetical protein
LIRGSNGSNFPKSQHFDQKHPNASNFPKSQHFDQRHPNASNFSKSQHFDQRPKCIQFPENLPKKQHFDEREREGEKKKTATIFWPGLIIALPKNTLPTYLFTLVPWPIGH